MAARSTRGRLTSAIFGLLGLLGWLTLASSPSSAQDTSSQCVANALAGGTANAITIPALACSTNTNLLVLTASAANTSATVTLQQLPGGAALPIVKAAGAPLAPGDIVGAGYVALLTSTGSNWILLNPNVFAPGAAAANLGMVSITASPYNADPTGVADSTAAIAAASASGARVVFVPTGSFKACGVVMSGTFNQHLLGLGPSSKLVQTNACGASPVLNWSQVANVYSEQTVSNLGFDSTGGNANTIDTTGAGGLTLKDLYFTNTPANHSNIYVNGAGGVATHDVNIQDIQVYDLNGGPHGLAMVEFGPLAVDSDLEHLVGNGAFLTQYGVYMHAGATTLRFAHNHPYNLTVNSIFGSCSGCQFVGDTWDNSSGGDVAYFTGLQNSTFAGEYFESINTAKNGIVLTGNSQGNTFTGTAFGTFNSEVANFAVSEAGGSDYNVFLGGTVSGLTSYAVPVFSFSGAHSYARSVGGYNNLGTLQALIGATSSAQAGNTTVFLGANGANASRNGTAFNGPFPGVVKSAAIATFAAVSGGDIVFTLELNGSSIGTCTAIVGSFGCNITATTNSMATDNQIDIQSANPAGGASTDIRYSILVSG